MSSKTVKILSIDGGGIRGLIPALILAEIEKRTLQPISSLFDLIAGTSTGGILGLGLTVPDGAGAPKFSALDLAKLYGEHGEQIFYEPKLFKFLGVLDDLFEETYGYEGIEKILLKFFGDTKLSESLTRVLITSYELESRRTFIFKSRLAKSKPDTEDFSMREVARSTSAAPTYFEPNQVKRGDIELALIDGGVFANNPATLAYCEAKEIFDTGDFKETGKNMRDFSGDAVAAREILEPFYMLSLGTGYSHEPIKYEKAKNWGLVQWARPVISIMMQGSSDSVHYQMRQLLPEKMDGTARYNRLDVTNMKPEHIAMDNAKPENIKQLRKYANDYIEKSSRRIDEVCRILLEE
jgi:patatin-like phospholipase/acyl hydrolase